MLLPASHKQTAQSNPCPKCQSLLWDMYFKLTKKLIVNIDRLTYRKFEKLNVEAPVIFIIGSPRSGTTLLYQTMIDKFKIFYPTNFLQRLYRFFPFLSPALFKLSKISSPVKPLRNYESYYGRTKGLYGPNEFGDFWYKFFPYQTIIDPKFCASFDYIPPESMKDTTLNLLRAEINYIYLTFRLPLIFKNVYNTMRVHGLIKALPESVFLITWRDPLYLSASIFNAKIKKYNNKNCWISVAPKEINDIIKLPVWDQIMLQIYYIYNQILEYIKIYGKNRFYLVKYENFVKNPELALKGIKDFLREQRIQLQCRNFIIPSFNYRRTEPIRKEEKNKRLEAYEKYKQQVDKIENKLELLFERGGR